MKKYDISNLTVSRIVDIYSYTLPEGHEAKSVCEHDVLIVKHSGESEYAVAGQKLLADGSHLLFLPKGTEYALYVEDEGECTVIEFESLEGEGAIPTVFFTGGESELLATVKNLQHYWSLRGPAYHSKCLSEMYSLVTQIASIQSYAYSLAGKYRLIHRSVKYIESRYHRQDLYTPMLAKMSGMGETYYRGIFQSVFGIPPTKYIQQYRVEKAKPLLVNSAGSIEEIALAVGFANASYFCKVFKATTGMTPTEFAEHARKFG